MSTETASTPKAQKTKKSKPESATTSAKKRRHDEQQKAEEEQHSEQEEAAETTRHKKARIHEPVSEAPPQSPFVQQTTSFYLPVAPIYHAFPLDGLCAEHISPLLLTYYPPLKGVLLSYSNPRLSDTPVDAPSSRDAPDAEPRVLAKSIDEYAVTYVWLTVDFVLLRPVPGAAIEGYVSVQNESYLGLVCWNFFNAGIERKRIPADWQWVPHSNTTSSNQTNSSSSSSSDWMRGRRSKADESQGYFIDGQGKRIDGLVKFTVKDFESAPSSERERGFLSIEGTLLDRAQDKQVDAELLASRKPKPKRTFV